MAWNSEPPGHEPVGPGSDAQGPVSVLMPPSTSIRGITTAAGALGTDGGNARGGGGDELLPAETGLHAHDQDQIDNAQIRENSFHRRAGRMLMPTWQPSARIAAMTSSAVSGTASRWKVMRLAPALAKSAA